MDDLGAALRAATDDVPERDHVATAWAGGRRRRARTRGTLAGAGVLVLAGAAAGGTMMLGTPVATVATGSGPVPATHGGPVPGPTTQGGATLNQQLSGDPRVWTDPRLVSPARAPEGKQWVVLVLARSEGAAPADVQHLAGTTWQQVPGSTYPWTGVYREVALSSEGSQQRVFASGGCNPISGAYAVSGDRVSAPTLAVAAMACSDENLMKADGLFYDLFRDATVVLGDDGRLYLAGFVESTGVPVGWTSDNRLGPYRGPGPSTLPPWARTGTGPHTEPGPRDFG